MLIIQKMNILQMKHQISDQLLSVICLSICLCVNFSSFLQSHSANFTLSTERPWVKSIQVCSNESPFPFPRGGENALTIFKNLHCQFHSNMSYQPKFYPNLAQTILGEEHFFYTCRNEGSFILQKGDTGGNFLFLSRFNQHAGVYISFA